MAEGVNSIELIKPAPRPNSTQWGDVPEVAPVVFERLATRMNPSHGSEATIADTWAEIGGRIEWKIRWPDNEIADIDESWQVRELESNDLYVIESIYRKQMPSGARWLCILSKKATREDS